MDCEILARPWKTAECRDHHAEWWCNLCDRNLCIAKLNMFHMQECLHMRVCSRMPSVTAWIAHHCGLQTNTGRAGPFFRPRRRFCRRRLNCRRKKRRIPLPGAAIEVKTRRKQLTHIMKQIHRRCFEGHPDHVRLSEVRTRERGFPTTASPVCAASVREAKKAVDGPGGEGKGSP